MWRRGLQDCLILSDSGYGDACEFRYALSRELDYAVLVSGDLMGWTEDPHPARPPPLFPFRSGNRLDVIRKLIS